MPLSCLPSSALPFKGKADVKQDTAQVVLYLVGPPFPGVFVFQPLVLALLTIGTALRATAAVIFFWKRVEVSGKMRYYPLIPYLKPNYFLTYQTEVAPVNRT